MHITPHNHTTREMARCAGFFNNSTVPRVTTDARRYALKELARRAGVSKDFFDAWKIESSSVSTTASFSAGSIHKIEFIHQPDAVLSELAEIPVARSGWPVTGAAAAEIDLILPFAISSHSSGLLYDFVSDHHVVCRLDLLNSFLFTLSRIEETLCKGFDTHGRFPAQASLAYRHGFLERPILDEHGLAFQAVLSRLLPEWQPQPRVLRAKLTHDIDYIGIPFDWRNSLGHALRRQPGATLRDFCALVSRHEPAQLASVRQLALISAHRGLQSAFYWKAGASGPFDSGYPTRHRKVQRLLNDLRNAHFELGIHPGYDTFGDRLRLASEVDYLREALQVTSVGGRQHYLRWSPSTWLDWESCGLSYDSSVGFADAFGFRCGTSFPFRPWCLLQNRELKLIELPLILMDCTAVKYMKLPRELALSRIIAMLDKIRRTGGVFTLLWHNSTLLDPAYAGWYESILDLLSGADVCQLPPDPAALW